MVVRNFSVIQTLHFQGTDVIKSTKESYVPRNLPAELQSLELILFG